MKKGNLFHMHIMWYEAKMVIEALDSLYNALQYSKESTIINICLNSQTYLEKPIEGKSEDMFKDVIKHPVMKLANITIKTDSEPFYGIGDWRRDQYTDQGYTIWGESDCIIPYDLFHIIENLHTLNLPNPHVITFGSRKMWDETWKEVEFIDLDKHSYSNMNETLHPDLRFNGTDVVTQEKLDAINDEQGPPIIVPINKVKFDGALLTLSPGLPTPFIAPGQQITHEDLCMMTYFQHLGIPQFHVKNRLKAHNGNHPLKRTNTYNHKMIGYRSEMEFLEIAERSKQAMLSFLNEKIMSNPRR